MTETRTCKRCGATLQPAGSLQGLCPACLMGLGMAHAATAGSAPYAGSEPPPDPAELAALLPAFEIEEILGQGGMGVVYRARQKSLDRTVAIKVLPASLDRDPSFHDRFAREARALASLNHPNIVGVYDFGRAGGHYFLAMEYVDGTDLRRMLQTERIAPRQALNLVGQLCDALQYAHDQGVVHRDIKPENVLIDRQGRVKVSDFGLAKLIGASGGRASGAATLTRADQIMGTPMYMAPEQVEHPLEVDHRADIYSLGVVFYELLTGELPLGRFASPSVAHAGVDARLDPIVLRALEKQPPERYQSASAIKTDVDRVAEGPRDQAAAASVAADAAEAIEDLDSGKRRGFFRRRRAGQNDSSTVLGCGLGALGTVIVVVLLLGCLGSLLSALFLARGSAGGPVPNTSSISIFPSGSSTESNGPAATASESGSRSVLEPVQTTPPGTRAGSLDSERPTLEATMGRAIDWETGTPRLAESLRAKAGISNEIWNGAQRLVDDTRRGYLALATEHAHPIPHNRGVSVWVDAFASEREALLLVFELDLETALGCRLGPLLREELAEQVLPLGAGPVTLELRDEGGVVDSSSRTHPRLNERGPRTLARFGHLLEPLRIRPPDAAAAVLELEVQLAALSAPPVVLSLNRVEARSVFTTAGPVVEIDAHVQFLDCAARPDELWVAASRALLQRDWILELQTGVFQPLPEPVAPELAGYDLEVHFVLQPADARTPRRLEPIDAEQLELQALEVRAALSAAFELQGLSSDSRAGDALRPASITVTGTDRERRPRDLVQTAAELSRVADEFGWSPVEFTWQAGPVPRLELGLTRARP